MNTLERNCSYCGGSGHTGPASEPAVCDRCSGTGRELFGNVNTADLSAQLDDISGLIKTVLEYCEKILNNLPKQ